MSKSATNLKLSKSRLRWAKSRMKVLVVTDNLGVIQPVLTNLRDLGLDVQLSLFDGTKLASIPNAPPGAVLCYFTDFVEKTKGICSVIRGHYAKKTPPIIGAVLRPTSAPTDHFDSVLFAPVHSSQIANRVDSMIRLSEMEAEILRRIETLRDDFGQDVSLNSDDLTRPFRILFIGKASPGFMIVINALQEKNVETVAAFTSFSAFDYLHDRQFDAVVMNAIAQPEPALTISETMRKNSKLYHVPTLFLVEAEEFQYTDAAYEHGARDLVPVDAELDEISGRILELANYHRIHEELKDTFGSLGGPECLDEESGVFNAAFFGAHMQRVSDDCYKKGQSLSVLAIKPEIIDGEDIASIFVNAGIVKIGAMLKNIVRMQDIVARFDGNAFLLAFPGADENVVTGILDRVENLVSSVAFDAGKKDRSTITFKLQSAIAEQNSIEDSETLIRRVLRGLDENSNPSDLQVSA